MVAPEGFITLLSTAPTCKLMTTAIILIEARKNHFVAARAIIDTAATSNFITENFARSLGKTINSDSMPITALENLTTTSKGKIHTKIRSRTAKYEKELEFQVVSEIAKRLPDQAIDRRALNIPKNLKLADPDFDKPAPVDMLLDVETALSILCIGQKKVIDTANDTEFCLQKTLFGWVIGGRVPIAHSPHYSRCMFLNKFEENLIRFWDLEDGEPQSHLSREELDCENHFSKNVTRDKEGRYILALPFNEKKQNLGESRDLALKRLYGLQRRLTADAILKEEYSKVLDEYISLGHMTAISKVEELTPGYYLPHHAVIKRSSLTTKVRVVFDGSAKTTTGTSLNDTLLVGPTIQSDLFSIILRFRLHNIVITADIEKMYRQFWIRPEDRHYQRVLWKNERGEIQAYQLNTVTFGLSAAPYLAIRALHQLAEDESHDFPIASKILKTDLYVDDALTGAETREQAIKLRDELTQLLKRAGLNIRQWASNDRALFADLPRTSVNLQLQSEESTTIKTLGLHWDPQEDQIIYTVKLSEQSKRITKRHILSETAKIFDPLGLLAPVIITAKILMQGLWALKLDWDESLPESIHSEWTDYYRKLSHLNNLSFKRHSILPQAQRIELHGFCDASQRAYGACIYARSTDNQGNIKTELLTAKTRVAPLKTVSIPRLELCGAVLLSTLMKTVERAMPRVSDAIFWTDSTIVLAWIKTEPQKLQTFVANRVSELQRNTNIQNWRHVRTHENPADLLSRGQSPDEFVRSNLWRSGPAWLRDQDAWPENEPDPVANLPELKKTACFLTLAQSAEINWRESILTRYSSFDKLQRIIAYVLRFGNKRVNRGPLSVNELENAHLVILRLTQAVAFPSMLENLRKGQPTTGETKIIKLNPFLDKDGIMRVGGRLRNAAMPYKERHPVILPKNNHITNLVIQREHRIHLHSGAQATLYAVRRRYWPIDGRSQVWKAIKKCIVCWKTQPNTSEYVMGDLPSSRVNESRPFSHVGVDYCGPFFLKEKKYRNLKKIKAYVAVFVCMAVKAVHLEIVSDLTTDAFIAALRRFTARRGLCSHIYSDNGTNFVGANNHLRDLMNVLKTEESQMQIREFLSNKQIEWHFSPPRSPHFGGLWEAAVKAFKKHLVKVAGIELLFTFEEFNTLAIEIEAVLNSRPLTPLSQDPNDLTVLTPGHFLTGESLTSLPDRDYSDIPTNRLSTWQHITKVKENFWTRWRREYLNELTCRQKWFKGSHNIGINSLVLLRDDNLPSQTWPLGRVVEIHPGADGIVRTVSVKTSTGILKRGIKAIVLLPLEPCETISEAGQPSDTNSNE